MVGLRFLYIEDVMIVLTRAHAGILMAIFLHLAYAILVPGQSCAATRMSAFVGYGISLFDEDFPQAGLERGHAGYLPVSLTASWGLRPRARAGLELSYSVIPFAFDDRQGLDQATEKVSQLLVGSFIQYTLTQSVVSPYVRGGAGLYLGQWVIDYRDDGGIADSEYDFKPAFGFNAGVGIIGDWAGERFLFLEFIYHLVSRELDISGAQRYDAGNLAVQLGMGSDL
jgi:hypothetical protein